MERHEEYLSFNGDQGFSERMQAFHFSRFEINKPFYTKFPSTKEYQYSISFFILTMVSFGRMMATFSLHFPFPFSLRLWCSILCVCVCLRVLKSGFQSHFPAHIFSKSHFPALNSHSGHGKKALKIIIPFPFCHFFPIPSTLNPIFPGQQKANPSSHFTPSGPSVLYHLAVLFSVCLLILIVPAFTVIPAAAGTLFVQFLKKRKVLQIMSSYDIATMVRVQ